MTGRGLGVLAAGAAFVAFVALIARPLLPRATPPPTTVTSPAAAPTGVVRLAEQAARRDLQCPGTSHRHAAAAAGCGRLLITRSEATCATSTRCQVNLLADLHSHGLTVPVALTVTVTASGQSWRVVEVAS